MPRGRASRGRRWHTGLPARPREWSDVAVHWLAQFYVGPIYCEMPGIRSAGAPGAEEDCRVNPSGARQGVRAGQVEDEAVVAPTDRPALHIQMDRPGAPKLGRVGIILGPANGYFDEFRSTQEMQAI
jgi:hypothetical protein